MTYLRSISRFVVVFMALAVAAIAAIPAGWIALRYDPPSGEEQKGHWIIVKAPEDGLSAWWSDSELAKIVANDPDYVKHLETGWSPEDHPVADAAEAKLLAAELAQYWDGDVPQANFWAHGALTRRGSTLRAFRWEQDGLTQRGALERSGARPEIPAAAVDPDPGRPALRQQRRHRDPRRSLGQSSSGRDARSRLHRRAQQGSAAASPQPAAYQ